MVKIHHKVVMTGIICLTVIYLGLLYTKSVDGTIGALVVGAICLLTGIVIPTPKIDNKRGVFIW